MQRIRVLGTSLALGGIVLLGGCVAVPGDPYYSGGYSDPYYADPVVVPAPVYIQGGGYYEQRRPYYGGRPYYDGRRPGYPYPGVRPTYPTTRPPWGGGRPPVAVVPRPGAGGVPGITPSQPQQMPRGRARLWTSPDSQGTTPP
jgi:hypothetical protein